MKIKESFVLTEIGEDYVAVPINEASEAFHGIVRLNESAAFIWRGIDSGLNEKQIAEKICAEYTNVEMKHALECTREMVNTLRLNGVVKG